MLTSLPYMKDSSLNPRLDEFVPKILEGFISSRFNSLEVIWYSYVHRFPFSFLCGNLHFANSMIVGQADDLSEDPLDKVELMQDQLDFFPYLCRYQVWPRGSEV